MLIVFFLAWIPLLALGVVRIRQGSNALGIILTVFSALWGLFALLVIGLALVVFLMYRSSNTYKVESFDPAKYQGKTAELKIKNWSGSANATVEDLNNSKTYSVQTIDGKFVLPAGKLQIKNITFMVTDKKPQTWTASIYCWGQHSVGIVDLKADQETPAILTMGPPFTIQMDSHKTGAIYYISMSIQDCGGNRVYLYNPTSGYKPSFKLLTEAGGPFWEKSLEYS